MPFNVGGNILTSAQLKYYNDTNIVRNGLIMYLDAGLGSSYPGSGTAWTDLSGNGYNGTLTNGPTYSTAGGGSIAFDYTDDYVPTTGMANYSYTNGITVAVWNYNGGGVGAYRGVVTNGIVGDRQGGFDLRYGREDSGRTLNWRIANALGTAAAITLTGDLSQWGYYVGTYDNSSVYGYKNGAFVSSAALSGGGQLKTMSGSTIIAWSPGTAEYLDGKLAVVQIYNRALTASEVLQNYQAQRQRFGV